VGCTINGSGIYFLSQYRSVLSRNFRGQSKSRVKSRLSVPGPGTYQLPSEFGLYKAQSKYIKEFERVDRIRNDNYILRASLKRKESRNTHEDNANTSDILRKGISVKYKI